MSGPNLLWIGLYLLVVVALVVWNYRRFNQPWRGFERARTTIGVCIVLMPLTGLALAGVVDWFTLIIVWIGFGAAGAITVGLDLNRGAKLSRDQEARLERALTGLGVKLNGTQTDQ